MMLAISDSGVWQGLATLAAIVAGAYVIVLWIAALAWTYRDITSRTSDQAAQALSVILVFVFNVPGLFLYLILRPKETLMDAYERQLEAEALLREINDVPACPNCRRRVSDDFAVCPYCRSRLRIPCESCARPLHQSWVVCPYCAADRGPQQSRQPAEAAATAQPFPADAKSQVMGPNRMRRPSTATYTPPAKPQGAATDTPAD